MERLNWMLTLYDRMSNPANRISQNLKRVSFALADGSKASFNFGKSSEGASSSLVDMGANLSGWMSIANKAWSVASGLATGIADASLSFVSFGVESLSTKESLLKSFELMLGSAEKANEFFRSAVDFAAITPFETKDVVDQYKRLLAAGFKQEEVPIVFQAVGDVAAMNNFSADTMNSITRAFGQMKGRGKLLLQELYQVTEAAGGAVKLPDVFDRLSKNLGIARNQVEDAISGGKIDADSGIFAILEAIRSSASGGELGKGMLDQAGTIKGLLSTIQSIPADLFYRMDLGKIPGLDAFKGFLKNIIELFDMTGVHGQELMKLVGGVFSDALNAAFGSFTGPDGLKNLKALFVTVMDGAKWAWDALSGLALGAKAFWVAFQPALDSLGPMKDEFGAMIPPGERLKVQLELLGGALGTIANWLTRLVGLISKVSGGFEGMGKAIFGTPAWDLMGLVGKGGSALGAGAPGAPLTATPELPLPAPSVGAAARAAEAQAAGLGRPEVKVAVNIDASGTSASAEEIGRHVEHALPTAITRAFEQLAMGGGVSGEPVTS